MSRHVMHRFIEKYGRLPTEVDPDYLEMLRMSKYLTQDVPMFKPGKCGNCGASKNDGRKYVDFQLEIDWYGTLYLCGHCIKDVATELGLFDELVQSLLKQEEEIAALTSVKEKGVELPANLIKAWEEFKEYYDSVHSSGNYTPSDIGSMVESESSARESAVNEPTTNTTKSRATKSTSSSRRENIRSLTELLDNSSKQ